MPDKELYVLRIPEGGLTAVQDVEEQSRARETILNEDRGDTVALGSTPGQGAFTVQFADEYANLRATEFRELANGMSQPVSLSAVGTRAPDDRYVIVKRADVARVDPRGTGFRRIGPLQLTPAGTRGDSFRIVRTALATVSHPFGNDTTAPVGVPATASQVRWFDETTGARAVPTVTATRTSRLGDVDILDANAAPYDDPQVIYDLPLAAEGETDCRVWDDYGRAGPNNADGELVWQKVFATSHAFIGRVVVENGLVRFTADAGANALSVETWNSGLLNPEYTTLALGASDWELYAIDLQTVSPAQVGGVMEFRDPSASPTAFHTVRFQLHRGAERILFSDDDPVPSGLQTRLDPVAADHVVDAYGDLSASPQDLRPRSEVF